MLTIVSSVTDRIPVDNHVECSVHLGQAEAEASRRYMCVD